MRSRPCRSAIARAVTNTPAIPGQTKEVRSLLLNGVPWNIRKQALAKSQHRLIDSLADFKWLTSDLRRQGCQWTAGSRSVQMLGAKIILDHNPQSFVLRGRFRYRNHSVAQLLESPSEGGCVKITLAVEMSIETAFGQPQFLQ